MSDFDIDTIKRDRSILLAELQQEKEGQHLHCPMHGQDRTGSMSIWQKDGVWYWKCHAGCGTGTIIDAVMQMRGLSTPKQAIRALAEDLGCKLFEPAPPPPKLQLTRAERFVDWANQQLIDRFDWWEEWAVAKRGIQSMQVIHDLKLGFVQDCEIGGWSWKIKAGWILPITDSTGALKAVKIHHEKKERYDLPKCFWMPFGEGPGKNAWQTLWPAPERFGAIDEIHLCPGELKAVALISAGIPATSITAGEGNPIPDGLLMRIKAKKICLTYDPDETGEKWKDTLWKQLSNLGFTVGAFTYHELDEVPKETELQDATDSDLTAIFGIQEDSDEVKELRRQCGDGDPRYWLSPGLSKEVLESFLPVAEYVEREQEQQDWTSGWINERDFSVGPYRQPQRIQRYHDRKRKAG